MGKMDGNGNLLEFMLITTEEGDTQCFPANGSAKRVCRLAGLEWLSLRVVRAAALAGYVIQVSAVHTKPKAAIDLVSHVLSVPQ